MPILVISNWTENKEPNMVIALNAALAVIVIVAVVAPLAWAIRISATDAATPAAARPQRTRSRRRARRLVTARPWA